MPPTPLPMPLQSHGAFYHHPVMDPCVVHYPGASGSLTSNTSLTPMWKWNNEDQHWASLGDKLCTGKIEDFFSRKQEKIKFIFRVHSLLLGNWNFCHNHNSSHLYHITVDIEKFWHFHFMVDTLSSHFSSPHDKNIQIAIHLIHW